MDLVTFLVWLLILACLAYFAFWLIGKMELQPPIRNIALAIVGVIFLIVVLGSLTGQFNLPTFRLR